MAASGYNVIMKTFFIGELADRFGLNPRTIRYYERIAADQSAHPAVTALRRIPGEGWSSAGHCNLGLHSKR
jgi:hypothetical protein